jgi:hypothetical protein
MKRASHSSPAAMLDYTHFALLHCIRRFHASTVGGDLLHLVGILPKRTTSRHATKRNSPGISRCRPSRHHSRSCHGACVHPSSSTHLKHACFVPPHTTTFNPDCTLSSFCQHSKASSQYHSFDCVSRHTRFWPIYQSGATFSPPPSRPQSLPIITLLTHVQALASFATLLRKHQDT